VVREDPNHSGAELAYRLDEAALTSEKGPVDDSDVELGEIAAQHRREVSEPKRRIPSAVVIGDGEAPLSEYLNRLADGRSFDGVPGLWVKLPAGSAVKNAGVALQHDLDELRWLDWDLWDDLDLYFRFLGMLYVQGSRGCPYRCTFCAAQGYARAIRGEGRYFRLRDPRAFAEELAHYYEQYADRGMCLFQMFDPVFTMDDDWVEEFPTAYRQLGMHEKLRYSAFSRIDHLTEEKVRLPVQSGCALLRVGVETGDDHVRQDVYGKRIDTETVRRIFRVAKANGIDFTAFYILGGPEETQQTFRETIRLAWELDAARSAFFVYKPFAETGIEQLEAADGGVDPVRWDRVDNIAWGGTTYGRDFSPRIVEAYQVAGYGLTFGRRWLRTLRRRGPRYFVDLVPVPVRRTPCGTGLALPGALLSHLRRRQHRSVAENRSAMHYPKRHVPILASLFDPGRLWRRRVVIRH
jgi:hypothetical protein